MIHTIAMFATAGRTLVVLNLDGHTATATTIVSNKD